MKTILDRFKITNFRSIEESDWIEVSDNTCLVGTNEAGKTNLLIALWKLNPANNEPIVPLNDFPRHLYSDYKTKNYSEDVFIQAEFTLNNELSDEIAKELKCDVEQIKRVLIQRKYDGKYNISFSLSAEVKSPSSERNAKSIEITDTIHQKILTSIPKFVYYSDYGNLDSEIFLERVMEDLNRTDLSESTRAKVRTLTVLFKYVGLSPQEIYELGNSKKPKLSEEEIKQWSEKKKERGVLLRSAATKLTREFKKWWLQGDYIFDFHADGDHFRINVSDKLRPEHIELEGRSRGLQWFFSFFLVFLVETKEGHNNTILLLDEPGLSLHPIAQSNLAKFFEKLSKDNQLIYTSHSPFLVDMDNLANVKAVYVDSQSGRTKISSNLRHNETDAEKSIYPVHAALGLTVSDTLLLGCKPILVEGTSDQIYLSLIKRFLIGKGYLKYSKEIVFIPTGGVKGMSPISKLVSSRDNDLPIVLLDSDKKGEDIQEQLKKEKYNNQKDKVIGVKQFGDDKIVEIEDLIEPDSLIKIIDKKFKADEDNFKDFHKKNTPIVNQIEEWAKKENIVLEKGWKVEIARDLQNKFDKSFNKVDEEYIQIWTKLFEELSK